MKRVTSLVASGVLAAATAAAAPRPRLLVVIARPDDPRALAQQASLRHDVAAMRERDVVVEAITPAQARARPDLGVDPRATFMLVLVGRDGGVKRRYDAPVAVSDIAALIDTMPMRRAEMRR